MNIRRRRVFACRVTAPPSCRRRLFRRRPCGLRRERHVSLQVWLSIVHQLELFILTTFCVIGVFSVCCCLASVLCGAVLSQEFWSATLLRVCFLCLENSCALDTPHAGARSISRRLSLRAKLTTASVSEKTSAKGLRPFCALSARARPANRCAFFLCCVRVDCFFFSARVRVAARVRLTFLCAPFFFCFPLRCLRSLSCLTASARGRERALRRARATAKCNAPILAGQPRPPSAPPPPLSSLTAFVFASAR